MSVLLSQKTTYKVGTEERIIKDEIQHNDKADILYRSGKVIRCVRERIDRSYYVVVYVLLGKFKAYGPKVVVKRTPTSICICEDEVQQISNHDEWYVWSYPHPEH